MSDVPMTGFVNTPLMRLEADQQRAWNIQAELNEPTWEEREGRLQQQRRAEIIRQANLPRATARTPSQSSLNRRLQGSSCPLGQP